MLQVSSIFVSHVSKTLTPLSVEEKFIPVKKLPSLILARFDSTSLRRASTLPLRVLLTLRMSSCVFESSGA